MRYARRSCMEVQSEFYVALDKEYISLFKNLLQIACPRYIFNAKR
ncbi:MAG: hypothetical protein JRJ06_06225 [Deltaproteobacteria bacterium]|nr:hypothetical protein [Deltaproteobacteria bacterium]MBW1912659.1 hypothetical protein [Deltaproteobacteria bacterium]